MGAHPPFPEFTMDLSLRWKLFAIALPTLLSTVLMTGVGVHELNDQDNLARRTFVAKDVVADILPPPMYLVEMRLVLSQGVEQTLPAERVASELHRLRSEYEARVAHWQAHPPHGLEKDLLGAQHSAAQRFMEAAENDVVAALTRGDPDGARSALPKVHALYQAHGEGVDRSVVSANAFTADTMADMDKASANMMWQLLALGFVSLAVAAALYWRVSRQVLAQARDGARVARAVADGRLDVHIEAKRSGDELGTLMASLGDMSRGLSGLVGQVRQHAGSITSAALQIAQGNQDLFDRSVQQATDVARTRDAVASMADTMQASARTAHDAQQRIVHAAEVAGAGGEAVARVVSTMDGIQSSSQRIADIIGVIDGIAFQTNILALNAAVEAARAASRWWRPRCVRWHSARPRPPARSRT
jgi:methyl-accepting chemotaxis protein